MRRTIMLVGLLAAGGVAALSGMYQRVEAAPQACLKFRDFAGLKKIDDRTYLASTKYGRAKYVVTLRDTCRSLDQPYNPYTVRLHSGESECFDRDNVLVFRLGQVCFIEDVKPAG